MKTREVSSHWISDQKDIDQCEVTQQSLSQATDSSQNAQSSILSPCRTFASTGLGRWESYSSLISTAVISHGQGHELWESPRRAFYLKSILFCGLVTSLAGAVATIRVGAGRRASGYVSRHRCASGLGKADINALRWRSFKPGSTPLLLNLATLNHGASCFWQGWAMDDGIRKHESSDGLRWVDIMMSPR
ncbi:hypothetical protein K437DRAFT_258843 [Tilletiaria anomala UBC 951]|uniref:Uncharacterized protein n=1 Tax=Tilletiaria anomala (strain ATCC 24038 / CBS 436.72 / UBC 951) TaxID=1037660 RepID=A0A066VHY7_TILAU|nr:uncharacterized protein K437DRAFT_258843 [Tilletiaria anomala UBC 951]KDN39908.1 hypothetical protein K437DRAFT_258843 [Tilletiaria anomala UBC 951]